MARLSINEVTTYRWSFEEDVANYLAAGITAIGAWRQKMSDFGEEKAVELLADSGLTVSNLLWAGGFTGADGRTYRDCVEDGHDAIRLAAAAKAGCLVVYSGSRGGHTYNHARRLFRDAMDEILPLAAELDVVLAIEPMYESCATEWTYLTTIDDTLELLEDLDSPQVKFVFDTYHMAQDASQVDRIGDLIDRIAIVHLGDSRHPPEREQARCRLGAGTLPLKEIISRLSDAGYDGFYDVELIGEEFEAADYHELIEHSRDAFHRLVSEKAVGG